MNDVWLEQHKTEIMEEVLVQDRFDVMFKEYEQGVEDYDSSHFAHLESTDEPAFGGKHESMELVDPDDLVLTHSSKSKKLKDNRITADFD